MYTMTGAVTGANVSGLTTPTYTLTADTAADDNARQSVVTALGGTQAGVTLHSVSSPFSVTVRRPKQLRTPGKANLNGYIPNIGRNTYSILVRKGVTPVVGQPFQIAIARSEFEIPAGSEVNDQANLKAMFSFVGGFVHSNANGAFDTATNAVL